MRTHEMYARMAELAESGRPFTLVTVTDVKGSSPRGVGAKMLVYPDGAIEETIGGGILEREAIAEALKCLASGESLSRTYQLRAEGEHALGTLCGGDVTLFFEPHVARRRVVIVGAGHIGQRVAELAAVLDYGVVVLDAREDMVSPGRFPAGTELICADPSRVAELCELGERTSVVIVAHTAEHDERALRSVVGSPAGYVGMIGSARKIRTIYERLRQDAVSDEALSRVHSPIGLDIGAETPAELALCIMAEIVADERGRLGDGRTVAAERHDTSKGPDR